MRNGVLVFRPTDPEFSSNLHALRVARLSQQIFTPDFCVHLNNGPRWAKSAHLRPDKFFEFDGWRVPVDEVIKVEFWLRA